MRRELTGLWLGRRPYTPVHELMQTLQLARQQGRIGDTVLFLEHEPVITLGRGAQAENVLLPEAALSKLGVQVVATGRGGDVTLHAPGQLVCYPIVDLSPDRRDVRRYVGDLRETMRKLAADYDVSGGEVPDQIGLWVDAACPEQWPGADNAKRPVKLGAIGVRISRWVTMHGFAFNCRTDLSLFDWIVPCGIREFGVTSLEALGRKPAALTALAATALGYLGEALDAEVAPLTDAASSSLAELLPAVHSGAEGV
ncbi:MAG TPA: lipoyl(octanoyl) transferase LipB [Polyangiaceae bacterium]|nr:lipoyl(octanoyl) transferase LipB [Polyangiaceae bacterium]